MNVGGRVLGALLKRMVRYHITGINDCLELIKQLIKTKICPIEVHKVF